MVTTRHTATVLAAAALTLAGCQDGDARPVPTATGSDAHIAATYGTKARLCTQPPGRDNIIGDVISPREDQAPLTLTSVSLRGAKNLKVVTFRAIPIPDDARYSPSGTSPWPPDTETTWWWEHGATDTATIDGETSVLVRLTRPDPARDGTAAAMRFTYTTSEGKTRVLDNDYRMLVARTCPDTY